MRHWGVILRGIRRGATTARIPSGSLGGNERPTSTMCEESQMDPTSGLSHENITQY